MATGIFTRRMGLNELDCDKTWNALGQGAIPPVPQTYAVMTTKNVKFFTHAFPHTAKGKNRDYTIAKK
jgi:hypothetical protein